MTDSELLAAIVTHGLSIRQIPLQVASLSDIRFHKEGNEIVLSPMSLGSEAYAKRKAWFINHTNNAGAYVFDDEAETIHRRFTKEIRIPKNAGHWMCQKVAGTSTRVEWSMKYHNLAPTLAQSVEKFLKSQS